MFSMLSGTSHQKGTTAMTTKKIKLYSLTTCAYCQAIKKMLNSLDVPYEFVDADLLSGDDQDALLVELGQVNPRRSFPTLVVDGVAITGYKVQQIKEAIGVRTEVDALYDRLRAVQEPKGYFFHPDRERTFDLLRALLTNKDRYGYMACPCRLASGDRRKDADILCPCVYREADVAEFGACYCQLYVSQDWKEAETHPEFIPERRPPQGR
jgi:ferredoxin-thioredoxin reductase catalytic subunit/glutaredoxin